ncbi:hypothetical protein QCA50_018659 [Cerrena zonata]|uniref:Uncharacterized protein n=1 Tax=Cerrena zonata TaxID=2478898 RepID=A0AAW0FCN0_9APHY
MAQKDNVLITWLTRLRPILHITIIVFRHRPAPPGESTQDIIKRRGSEYQTKESGIESTTKTQPRHWRANLNGLVRLTRSTMSYPEVRRYHLIPRRYMLEPTQILAVLRYIQ